MNIRFIIGTLIVLLGISILFDLNLFRLLLPLILIWVGVQVIMGKDNGNPNEQIEVQEHHIKRIVVFSSINQKVVGDNFQGGEVITVFGGGEVDFSQVKTKEKEIKIDLVAICGGLEITVPDHWIINSEGVGVLGGFDNKANGSQVKKTVEVTIKGVAILGGVQIRN
ncbi:MAG TPA: hypothetical protein PLS49_06985 [Candidatus Woesebacteria bacterium]|nr:hypothetical protein [Candidatus Woesebacteria bacterium]